MKRLSLLVLAFSFSAVAPIATQAQEPDDPILARPSVRATPPGSAPILSPGEVAATPEMWFYEQERMRYADPRQAVRAQAEYRAAQRSRRLAALKWFGFSNSRPTASPDPIHGTYSPRFVGNGYIPSHWIGGGGPTVVVAQEPVRRY